MKKFLAVFDGYKMSKSTMDYAIQLTRASGAHLVGVFLDEFIYHTYNVYKVLQNADDADEEIKKLDEQDKNMREDSVLLFEKTCGMAKITFSVHRDKNIAIKELQHESMFADLIIINEYETFSKYKEQSPTNFIKSLLSDVQCPVIVVPSSVTTIDKMVWLYDGGPSSLYAVKMASYLLGNLTHLPVEVFTVKGLNQSGTHVPDNKLLREFIKRHFPSATYTLKKGVAEEIIPEYLMKNNGNELVVLGAYRRSDISRWFKTSMADILMKELDTPLFIAHNK